MPNWALTAATGMTLAADIRVLLLLAQRANYRQPTYTTKQIAIALELDPRTAQASTARLAAQGLVLSHEGHHGCKFPASRLQAPRKPAASRLQKDSHEQPKNDVQDSENAAPNKGIKEERKASYASSTSQTPVQAGGQAASREAEPSPVTGGHEGPDGPAAHAAPEHLNPSQVDRTGLANAGTATSTGGFQGGTAAPRAEDAGDDGAALRLFHDLAGYRFASDNRLHLARWADAYSVAFLRLAWRLAPTVPGVKIPATAFIWLLNREREWPDALKAQYEQDLAATLTPAPAALDAPRVRAGDLLRWPDGHTATVERVDRTDAVTDSSDDARGYVPLSQIGRGVEVLRS